MTQLVRDVMTTGVETLPPHASLVEAAQLMRDRHIGDVFVAQGDQVLGVLTDRDITVRAVAEGPDPHTVPVRSVCTPDVVTVGPDDEVSDAVLKMRRHAVRRLPVVEKGHMKGVVSLGDLAVARDPDSALADVSEASPNNGM
ncbi:CBS domain-containing protein [Streptomyces sp. A3M-1-3]|uniref:CBS domain-containing protein n=1 Tax=Streptomyces sp. A3M-1-3 TaxID=2962044 RepID=UPI0020B8186B|nr:CBS domain-containing protein [Streptomyces sp. A3M-1-3]MCP3820680.1 CBS domain-containing protein [Streptomyces sp. A3M-1-3]